MKHSKKKTSLLIGLILIITGAGGIGYIPGKPMLITIVSAMVLVTGILIALSCPGRNKSGRGLLSARNRRIPFTSAGRKNYSQYAA